MACTAEIQDHDRVTRPPLHLATLLTLCAGVLALLDMPVIIGCALLSCSVMSDSL